MSNVIRSLTFEAYLNQIDIGWYQAFKEKMSKLWGVATVTHSKEKGDSDLAERWSAQEVISSLWVANGHKKLDS